MSDTTRHGGSIPAGQDPQTTPELHGTGMTPTTAPAGDAHTGPGAGPVGEARTGSGAGPADDAHSASGAVPAGGPAPGTGRAGDARTGSGAGLVGDAHSASGAGPVPGAGPGGDAGPGAAGARTGPTADGGTLLPHEECDKLGQRLHHAVAGFVDAPRASVEEADRVLEEVTARFTDAVTHRRRTLRTSWHDAGDDHRATSTDTEQLRLALRDYRELVDRLMRL
ncbi:hypothetical protein ACIGO6_03350 [Streptomyces sp. NPDC053750]|uniref:hypothetical protein n=1 Tax=Streptomyces sp. NPDC053750 TaxID=3365714 RepID=UPI0037D6E1A2